MLWGLQKVDEIGDRSSSQVGHWVYLVLWSLPAKEEACMLVPHEAFKVTQDFGIFSLCQSQPHETSLHIIRGQEPSGPRRKVCGVSRELEGTAGPWMNFDG